LVVEFEGGDGFGDVEEFWGGLGEDEESELEEDGESELERDEEFELDEGNGNSRILYGG
jgi:hypothetical protein